MNNVVISLIRTWVPIIVGSVVSWLATRGWNIDPTTSGGLIVFLTGLFSGVYYGLVRIMEVWFPWMGALLGHTAKPKYVNPPERTVNPPGRVNV